MKDSQKANQPKIPHWMKVLTFLAVGAAISAVLVYRSVFSGPLAENHEIWSQFGDYVGGILNPTFAFFGLLALLYTIVLQSQELKESREQLEKSAAAFEQQNKLMVTQNFESSFFQLLRLYSEVLEAMDIEVEEMPFMNSKSHSYKGRECVAHLHYELLKNYLHSVERGDYADQSREKSINKQYLAFYSNYGHLIGHYFRTIYSILKTIKFSQLDEAEKKRFADLLRAQLSKYELGLLLYNCISDLGRENMLPLICEFNTLKHLEDDAILQASDRKYVRRT